MPKPQFDPAQPQLSTMAMMRYAQNAKSSGFMNGNPLSDSLLTAYYGAWWRNAPETFGKLLGVYARLD